MVEIALVENYDGTFDGRHATGNKPQPPNNLPVSADRIISVSSATAPGTLLGTLTATDADNDPINFSKASGDPQSQIVVGPDGQISYNASSVIPLSEGSIPMTVTVSDGTDSITINVTINILPVINTVWDYTLNDPTVFHPTANPSPWINDPRFIPDPGRPTEWASNTEAPGNYYVDFGNTTGNATDSNNQWGTPSQPRLTLPIEHTNDGAAGSTTRIEITGNMAFTQRIELKGQDEANLIFLVNDPVTPCIFSDREPEFRDCRYAIIEGVVRQGPNTDNASRSGMSLFANTEDVHHVCFRDITIRDIGYSTNGRSGFSIGMNDAYKAAGGQVYSVVLFNFDISGLGDNYPWDDADYDFHGISIGSFAEDNTTGWAIRHVWLLDIRGTRISGDTVQLTGQSSIGGSERDTLFNFNLGRISANDNRQTGVGVKTVSRVVIADSKCVYARAHGAASSGGGFGSQYSPDEIWFVNCDVYNSPHGIRRTEQQSNGTGKEDIYFYMIGCTFFDVQNYSDAGPAWSDIHGGAAVYHQRGNAVGAADGVQSKCHIYTAFCTFFTCRRGASTINEAGPTGREHSINFYSNVVHVLSTYGVEDPSTPSVTWAGNGPIGPYVNYDNNLYVTDAGGQAFIAKQDNVIYPDIAAWRANRNRVAGAATDENSVEGPANFVSASTDPNVVDLRVQAGSAAIGLASRVAPDGHDPFTKFQNLFGFDIYVDRDGNPRGVTNTAGAFEYQA